MSGVRKYTRTKHMTEDEYKEYLEKRKEEKRLYALNYMRKRREEDPEFKAKQYALNERYRKNNREDVLEYNRKYKRTHKELNKKLIELGGISQKSLQDKIIELEEQIKNITILVKKNVTDE